MLLAWHRGEQYPRRTAVVGCQEYCVTQCVFDLLGIEMLFMDGQLATRPRFAYPVIEIVHGLGDKALETLAHQSLRQPLPQTFAVVRSQNRHEFCKAGRVGVRGGCAQQRQSLEFVQIGGDYLPGSMAGVDQPLDYGQALDLAMRVDTFAMDVADGFREPVAALPDAQGVFAQACITLDRPDTSMSLCLYFWYV